MQRLILLSSIPELPRIFSGIFKSLNIGFLHFTHLEQSLPFLPEKANALLIDESSFARNDIFDFIRALKKNPDKKNTRIFILTSNADYDRSCSCIKEGIDGLFSLRNDSCLKIAIAVREVLKPSEQSGEKRERFRYAVSQKSDLCCFILKHPEKSPEVWRVNDISMGGISVLLGTESEAVNLKNRPVNAVLMLNRNVLPMQVEMVSYEGQRAAFAFRSIEEEHREQVAAFISRQKVI